MRLKVTKGPSDAMDVEVAGERFVIGRDPACDLVLSSDDEVSRRHAALKPLPDGRVEIEDLDSRNGTYVNGSRLTAPQTLSGGEEIEIGLTTLTAEAAASGGGETKIASRGAETVVGGVPPAAAGTAETPTPPPAARPPTPAEPPAPAPQPPPAQPAAPQAPTPAMPPPPAAAPPPAAPPAGQTPPPPGAPRGPGQAGVPIAVPPPRSGGGPPIGVIIAAVVGGLALIGVILFLVLAGTTLRADDVENDIREGAEARLAANGSSDSVTDVQCPDDIEATTGETFTCDIELSSGTPASAHGEVTDGDEREFEFTLE